MTRVSVPRACAVCGTVFIPHPRRQEARYCSRSCIWQSTKGAEFNAKVARETAEKRGSAMRGRGEGRSYRKLNGRHEHRVVAEQKIGRRLKRGEVVHHIDGNHLNNHPDNLEVMSQREHMRLHEMGVPGLPPHRFRGGDLGV